jgi:hypothetical protein
LTRALDRPGYHSLVQSAAAGYAARGNLSPVRHETPDKTGIFIIYSLLVNAKNAGPFLSFLELCLSFWFSRFSGH